MGHRQLDSVAANPDSRGPRAGPANAPAVQTAMAYGKARKEVEEVASRSATRGQDGPAQEALDEAADNEARVVGDGSAGNGQDDEEKEGRHVGDVAAQDGYLREGAEEEGAAALYNAMD